jgi:hypothetical protein
MGEPSRHLLRGLRDAQIDASEGAAVLRRTRPFLFAAYLVALAGFTWKVAVPVSLQYLVLWLSAAMLVASVGNPLGWVKGMFLDWLPLYIILICYSSVRGVADNLGEAPHEFPQRQFDQFVFGSGGLTGRLQSWLWTPHRLAIWDYGAWTIYMTHFFLGLAVAAALWIRDRGTFLAFSRRLVGLWMGAIMVFAAYPTVPPWMAANNGSFPHLTRIVGRVWHSVTSEQIRAARPSGGRGSSIENAVAAVPSLHAAIPMMICLFMWSRWRRGRPLLVVYAFLMGVTLVYVGEHFVFDVLAGWLLAVVVHLAVGRYERRGSSAAGRDLRDPGLPEQMDPRAWSPAD